MPAENEQHHEESRHMGNRHVRAVAEQSPTDLPSGYMLARATPAEEPNQIIDPPKPTA